jgi:acetyltransferase-like isoleucine patch superfamily enzyme
MNIFAILLQYVIKIINRISLFIYLPLFNKKGKNIRIFPLNSNFSYSHIRLGNNVFIGPRAWFSSINLISIGNNVMCGPNVTIITGDHRYDVIGKFMYDVKNKRDEDDQHIIIEDDVWIAANVTILKGVTIGRGCVIAACSLVLKSLPAYSIAAGIPAKPIKLRWSIHEIMEHEKILYSIEDRSDINKLIAIYKTYKLM